MRLNRPPVIRSPKTHFQTKCKQGFCVITNWLWWQKRGFLFFSFYQWLTPLPFLYLMLLSWYCTNSIIMTEYSHASTKAFSSQLGPSGRNTFSLSGNLAQTLISEGMNEKMTVCFWGVFFFFRSFLPCLADMLSEWVLVSRPANLYTNLSSSNCLPLNVLLQDTGCLDAVHVLLVLID